MNPNRIKSLIGLELGGHRLVAVEMHRSGGQVAARRKAQGALSLDPLTSEPELVAREIANVLAEGGIRGSNCLLCLPLSQFLTCQIDVPEIDAADLQEFLNLEAERAFPFSSEDLVISTSYFTDVAGRRRATMMAISASHVATLENVLRLAKLRPVGITLGAAALMEPGQGQVQAIITRNEAGLEMIVAGGGGLMTLRSLGEAAVLDDREGALDVESLAREARITLGRLPKATRDAIGRARAFMPAHLLAAFQDALGADLKAFGIELAPSSVNASARVVEGEPARAAQGEPPSAWPAGLTMATARWMQPGGQALDFLPPRVSKFQHVAKQMMGQGGLWRLGSALGVIVLLVAGAFVWQSWRLGSLQAQWQAMTPKFNDLNGLQQLVVKYRPWFDDDAPSLVITSKLVEAFPAIGTVWAKDFQIESVDASDRAAQAEAGFKKVSCVGNAASREDVMKIYQNLLKIPGVAAAEPPQFRGDKPIQFTLTYTWNPMESR